MNIKIKKLLLLILFTLIGFYSSTYAHDDSDLDFFHPVDIKKKQVISIMDCVSLAYQNSPKIKRQKYNLDLVKSNLGLAKSAYFPTLSAGVGFYNENNSDSVYYDKHYRDLPSVGVSINKMIWDFGRTTANIKMEEFYKIAAEYEFMDSLCATLFDVKWKYYNLLRTKALKDIEEENVKLAEDIKNITNKSPDKEISEIYLNHAKHKLVEAANNFHNAKVDLDNSMYLSSAEDYTIEDTESFSYKTPHLDKSWNNEIKSDTIPFKREDSPKIAYKNSPDLHVLIATRKAMEQALKYIKRTYLPELGASAGYGYNNTNLTSNSSLRVGVNLTSSVNLMELKHSIKGADAQLSLAQNEIELFKKDLYYEIQRAFNNVEKAQNQLPIAKKEVLTAIKTYNSVIKSYESGDLDYTALNDARTDYINANRQYIETVYNYNTALIQVEMAMHCHLVDIHHKSGHAVHHHSEELIDNLIKALECTIEPPKKRGFKFTFFKDDIEEDEDL